MRWGNSLRVPHSLSLVSELCQMVVIPVRRALSSSSLGGMNTPLATSASHTPGSGAMPMSLSAPGNFLDQGRKARHLDQVHLSENTFPSSPGSLQRCKSEASTQGQLIGWTPPKGVAGALSLMALEIPSPYPTLRIMPVILHRVFQTQLLLGISGHSLNMHILGPFLDRLRGPLWRRGGL